tara:strand:+ start:387 stop:527 length:141 start_codon:yes stop_codon:yes gene_type:complete
LTETILDQVLALSIKQLAPGFVMTAKVKKVDQGVAIMAIIKKHNPY